MTDESGICPAFSMELLSSDGLPGRRNDARCEIGLTYRELAHFAARLAGDPDKNVPELGRLCPGEWWPDLPTVGGENRRAQSECWPPALMPRARADWMVPRGRESHAGMRCAVLHNPQQVTTVHPHATRGRWC